MIETKSPNISKHYASTTYSTRSNTRGIPINKIWTTMHNLWKSTSLD